MRTALALLSALAALALGPSVPAVAQRLNVVVLGQDNNSRTVSRTNPIFKTAQTALQEQIGTRFNTYDLTAVSRGAITLDAAAGTDAELIAMVRAVKQPPIDVVVIYQIHAWADPLSYRTALDMRLSARVLDVRSGESLFNHEIKSLSTWSAPAGCDATCMILPVANYQRILAQDLGQVIAEQLGALVERRPRAYELVFENFCAADARKVEEYLVGFRGYQTHRPIEVVGCRQVIWYEASINSASLNRWLGSMASDMGVRANIKFEGNRFHILRLAGVEN